jgi:hypothetical protein
MQSFGMAEAVLSQILKRVQTLGELRLMLRVRSGIRLRIPTPKRFAFWGSAHARKTAQIVYNHGFLH